MINGINAFNSFSSTNINNEPKKELDKEAFLKILMTQLKYQDPTNTMNDKEFISQMSQLSSTEQIMNMSKSFQNMVSSQMNLFKVQASNLIGKTVVVENNKINLTGGFSDAIIYNLDEPTKVYVDIYDNNENLIFTKDLGIQEEGMKTFNWDGIGNSGVKLSDGEYKYDVYTYKNGEKIKIGGLDGGKVDAVQFENNNFYVLVNGQKYSTEKIIEISEI
ncbi:flagellar hook assembly protein FlgD [Marinitoga sp. 38H-ov]|uniref:flagellar hook assembly protein FlgD n=1 Tax=Marinitoga sp. 38H-ov TaxID=1755814 RepID=UPI0013EB3B26|nr:flagellar hook assembly protein FlgD [Marinitoga sp. 38H-ov]KAF2955889.1 flagellar biosynthesis protein FlgD [Marinitoga sp. 38H-ov]